MFRRNASPQSSRSKRKPSENCSLLIAGFLLGLHFDPDDVGIYQTIRLAIFREVLCFIIIAGLDGYLFHAEG
jgi:hypothetical protein